MPPGSGSAIAAATDMRGRGSQTLSGRSRSARSRTAASSLALRHRPPMPALPASAALVVIAIRPSRSHHAPRSGADFATEVELAGLEPATSWVRSRIRRFQFGPRPTRISSFAGRFASPGARRTARFHPSLWTAGLHMGCRFCCLQKQLNKHLADEATTIGQSIFFHGLPPHTARSYGFVEETTRKRSWPPASDQRALTTPWQ